MSSSATTTDMGEKDQRKNKADSNDKGKNGKNGNKKRKREAGGKKNRWRKDQENYYHRLLHGAQKDLRKQAKVVRTFECQKSVRKIKERQASKGSESAETSSASQNTSSVEESYQQLKNFDLDRVVQESLRRLGILHLDPKLAAEVLTEGQRTEKDYDGDGKASEESEKDKDMEAPDNEVDKDKKEEPNVLTDQDRALVERILKHKKMQSTLENWNGQVTEYRRWSLQQQDRENPRFGYESQHIERKKKGKKTDTQAARGTSTIGVQESDKSQFLRLGGEEEDDAPGQDAQYGPGSFVEEKKKNRKGQRARRAKAMAIEAKKAGRLHLPAESVNWRPKKQYQPTEEEEGGGYHKDTRQHAAGSSQPVKEKAAPAETLHPSWAAAKKDSSGIVKFQGTKITF